MAETAEQPTKARRTTKAKQMEQVARGYFDAVARRDLDAMEEFWHDDAVADFVADRPYRGKAEYRGVFEQIFGAFPDMEFTVTRITATAQLAVVEWRLTGTFTGTPFQGVEANGKRVELRGVDCVEIDDGKIRKNTAYYDAMAIARGIGLMPPQESSAERTMKQAFNAVTKVRRAIQDRR